VDEEIRTRAFNDLKKVEVSIARLEEQLRRAHEEKKKLEHFLEMIDRYASDSASENSSSVPLKSKRKSERLREIAIEFIGNKQRPTPTHEILNYILSLGETVEAREPASYISSVLSRDDRFQNVNRKGWILCNMQPTTVSEVERHDPETDRTRNFEAHRRPSPPPPPLDDADDEESPDASDLGDMEEGRSNQGYDNLDDDIPF